MKYVIIPKIQLTAEILRDCVEKEYIRESVDGSLVVLKYAGMKPLNLLAFEDLTQAQALVIMQSSTWHQAGRQAI